MMTSVRKTLKALALQSLPQKFAQNSHEITQFLCKFVPENPAQFDFFCCNLSEALINAMGLLEFCLNKFYLYWVIMKDSICI